MTRRTRNIFKGIGSVLDIYPNTDYSEYLSNIDINGSLQTDAENLHGYWVAVGGYIRHAMSIADVEDDKKVEEDK
ncbi:MAG: hypothetical protein HQK95_05130 [Nitrospirae bacterium]|nr:hypothetical protein [Nitrospirota bacterium]